MSWNNALLNLQIPHQYCMGSQNTGIWWAIWILGSIVLKPACLDFTCQCTGLESNHCCVVVTLTQLWQLYCASVGLVSQQEIILPAHRGENLKTMQISSASEIFLLRIRNKYIHTLTNSKGERLFLVVVAHCFRTFSPYLQILITGRKDWY